MPASADIFHMFSRLLYKLIPAFRAGDLYLSLASRNADLLSAGRAFEKTKDLCLFPLFTFAVKVFKNRLHHPQESLVLPRPSGVVMREKTEDADQKRNQSDRIQPLQRRPQPFRY